MGRYYRSNRSIILGLFLWGILFFSFAKVYSLLEVVNVSTVGIIISSLVFIPMGVLWFGLGYRIEGALLIVKVWSIIKHRILIEEIISINRSFSPLGSPAASLKRIKLSYKGGELLISPINY